MKELTSNESPFPKLSLDEILELERIYNDVGEKSLDPNFCKDIAANFSSSSNSDGKTSLTWEQVQQWLQNKHTETKGHFASSPEGLNLVVDLSGKSSSIKGNKSSPKPKGIQAADLSELAFEAVSIKDNAWHDVSMFLNYRVLCTGELEVRVRYHGFGKDEDEWINVKYGVRQRSIPLEASECHKVKEGHLVLCFHVKSDYALYCDAIVLKIQRREHDSEECSCIFTVRFYHDKSEEEVRWDSLCCRPTQEESEVPFELEPTMNPIANLWG
ncbi:putative SAWADEE domain-containing protein [Medicago truncatula]|uniref:Putative SAWADEE domain-containing protein n=1 Tax=Medicago truncatula TaxID=3880 RepID=A0A072TMY2_MEDTR|nr:protein SAWADEE HOMEODOMAIN HOMOLOG 1 [Medicago truncatula]KEH18213.1 sequence-specific DNA-binding transcription factor [Medicago truncatula]RHN39124.1 putative SAWADEE domain-containing protein [Medicago truncatula]